MWDGRVEGFCSGHWINQVLEPKDMKWLEYRGDASGYEFPLVHRWSYWPECALESPRRIEEKVSMPERSTTPSAMPPARITRAEKSVTDVIRISPSPSCVELSVDTVVYDHAAGREIAFYNPVSEYKTLLLRRMMQDGAVVQLYGVRHAADHSCRANMLWGSK
jgi:hypothetical protein